MEQNYDLSAIYKVARLAVQLMPQILDVAGIEALQFIDDNFQSQGFHGTVFEPWEKRKKTDKRRPGRNVLIDSGHLRRSFRTQHAHHAVNILTDSPYAQVHNEGGTIQMPARNTILNFKKKKNGKLQLGKVRTENQQRTIRTIRRASVGAYNITMPKRQFIGYSPVLSNKVEVAVLKLFISHLKSI